MTNSLSFCTLMWAGGVSCLVTYLSLVLLRGIAIILNLLYFILKHVRRLKALRHPTSTKYP